MHYQQDKINMSLLDFGKYFFIEPSSLVKTSQPSSSESEATELPTGP